MGVHKMSLSKQPVIPMKKSFMTVETVRVASGVATRTRSESQINDKHLN